MSSEQRQVTESEIEVIRQCHLAANPLQGEAGWQFAYDSIDKLLRAIIERDEQLAQRQSCIQQLHSRIDAEQQWAQDQIAVLAGEVRDSINREHANQAALDERERIIEDRNRELQVCREALSWVLDQGVLKAVHHVNGERHARLVNLGDYDPVNPPAHLRDLLAEITGVKS